MVSSYIQLAPSENRNPSDAMVCRSSADIPRPPRISRASCSTKGQGRTHDSNCNGGECIFWKAVDGNMGLGYVGGLSFHSSSVTPFHWKKSIRVMSEEEVLLIMADIVGGASSCGEVAVVVR